CAWRNARRGGRAPSRCARWPPCRYRYRESRPGRSIPAGAGAKKLAARQGFVAEIGPQGLPRQLLRCLQYLGVIQLARGDGEQMFTAEQTEPTLPGAMQAHALPREEYIAQTRLHRRATFHVDGKFKAVAEILEEHQLEYPQHRLHLPSPAKDLEGLVVALKQLGVRLVLVKQPCQQLIEVEPDKQPVSGQQGGRAQGFGGRECLEFGFAAPGEAQGAEGPQAVAGVLPAAGAADGIEAAMVGGEEGEQLAGLPVGPRVEHVAQILSRHGNRGFSGRARRRTSHCAPSPRA